MVGTGLSWVGDCTYLLEFVCIVPVIEETLPFDLGIVFQNNLFVEVNSQKTGFLNNKAILLPCQNRWSACKL